LRDGVFWRDMEVANLPSGRPTLRLTGGALERLRAMTPDGHEAVVHVTLTDDPPLAQAFVVIERGRSRTPSRTGVRRPI
jgi:holo-[acyl-carrier protein] synthase